MTPEPTPILSIEDVEMDDRIRKDLGDIAGLMASIKEFGIIQPVVLAARDGMAPKLVAGGRRMTAMKKLGFTELRHGKEYIWRDELADGSPEVKLKHQAIELEENLKRKELSWPEQVLGKQRLLTIMQTIHGTPSVGGLTREERRTGVTQGFGVRKLAAMLGESPAATSKDLQLAVAVSRVPILRQESSKDSAMKKVISIVAKAVGKPVPGAHAVQQAKPLEYRVMVFCDSEQHQIDVMTELQARGLKCQPLIV